MTKFIFAPLWRTDKTEETLINIEKNGYRLINVKFNHWFEFKECKPKKTNYICTFTDSRGMSMDNWDNSLLTQYNAEKISSKYTMLNYYRVPNPKHDLSFLKETKEDFMKNKTIEISFIFAFYFAIMLFLFILEKSLSVKILFGILSLILLIVLGTYLCGLTIQIQKCRMINKKILKSKKKKCTEDSEKERENF